MRQIKFRYTCEDMSGQMFQIFKELTDFLNGGMNMHGRIQAIVAVDQYTGLKDRNGVEIYEGDIVEFDKKEWGGDDNIHVVAWDSEEGCWNWGGGITSDMIFRKVIGNIHTKTETHVQP